MRLARIAICCPSPCNPWHCRSLVEWIAPLTSCCSCFVGLNLVFLWGPSGWRSNGLCAIVRQNAALLNRLHCCRCFRSVCTPLAFFFLLYVRFAALTRMRLKNWWFSFGALLVRCATGLSSLHSKNPCGCVSRLPCPIHPAECNACMFLAYAVCEAVTTVSSVFLCPFVARARATCSIAFQGLCLKSIRPSKVGDSKTSECTCGQEHGPPIFLASPQTGRSQRKGLMGTTTRRARSAGQQCDGGERRRSSFLSRYGLILAQSDVDRNGNLFSAPSKSQPSWRLMSPGSPHAAGPMIRQNPQNEKLLKPGCSMTPAPLRRVSASP